MLKAYLDTTDSIWLDEAGNEFRNGTPSLIVGGHEQIKVTLVKASPNRGTAAANPDSWERDTSWNSDGITAMLTIDNDYKHLNKLSFAQPPEKDAAMVLCSSSGINMSDIPVTGELYFYKSNGYYDAVAYTDVSTNGSVITFSTPTGVPGEGYMYAAIPQSPLATAYLSAESDLSQGELVFDLVVNSKRLLELTAFSSIANVSISGIELLFYRTTAENNIEKIRAYMWDSVSLRNSQGNPGYQAEPPDPVKDMIAAAVAASVGGLQDVVIEQSAMNIDMEKLEAGKRYLLRNLELPVAGLTVSEVENSSVETQIWFRTEINMTLALPASVGWIGEPSFEDDKFYIISIQNNVAIACEYTPGV
jgi:hypothetical protein